MHVQIIQYFAPKYLGVHTSNFEKILLARAKYSILCTWIPGGPYIQLQKNTSCTCKVFNTLHLDTLVSIYPISKKNTFCTCKVFNTLHLNTWGSIYPTSKKYFLHMQSIKYFAHRYLGVHISNFKEILLAHAKNSILCTLIHGGPYIQLQKKYFLHMQSIQYFASTYLGVQISNFKKYSLHVQSIQYFAPKYLVVNRCNF